MRSCLAARGGEVSARNRAAKLAETYLRAGRGRAQGFPAYAGEFRFRPERRGGGLRRRCRRRPIRPSWPPPRPTLRRALEPPRLRLLTQFTTIPDGRKFLVDLRGFLLKVRRDDKLLAALEADLRGLLAAWFDIGFLELQRIDWNSPAALLEKLVGYEAVHEIRSWRDLKNRLDSDRRCYAFFHPRMPGEPLIFVEVALVKGLAGSVQRLLDEKAPLLDPHQADTAIFYSISNCQAGLAGISFGNFLIKRVVEELSGEFRNLKTFATLSPIPGFRAWLDEKLAADQPGLLSDEEAASLGSAMPAPSGEQALAAHPGEARLVARCGAAQDRRTGAAAAVRALSAGGGERRQAGARSGGAFPSVERRAGGADQHAGRHLGEGRQGERDADGELPV